MITPKFPPDEEERLSSLLQLKILDTPIEERFERISRLTKSIFNVPIVIITLIDHDRQWFKSQIGLTGTETPRDVSFCGHTILSDDVMVVEDALNDHRFFDNPFVTGDPNIRFYAGCPLKSPEGKNIGTLCIIDQIPRDFEEHDCDHLKDLSLLIEAEISRTDICYAQKKLISDLNNIKLSALVDPLTRLWNRKGIENIVSHMVDYSNTNNSSFGLGIADIDFFKKINDTYGHLVGDKVLQIFSSKLISVCRNSDAVGRWGGEEFIIVINSTKLTDIKTIAERFRGDVENHAFDVLGSDASPINVTCTIGVSIYNPEQNMTASELVNKADKALYEGKASGRNRVILN